MVTAIGGLEHFYKSAGTSGDGGGAPGLDALI